MATGDRESAVVATAAMMMAGGIPLQHLAPAQLSAARLQISPVRHRHCQADTSNGAPIDIGLIVSQTTLTYLVSGYELSAHHHIFKDARPGD